MDPAQRARLLFYGAQRLMSAIQTCDLDKKLDELITSLREARKFADERRRVVKVEWIVSGRGQVVVHLEQS